MEVSRHSGSCGCHFSLHDVGTLQRLLTPGRHQPSLSQVISAKSPSTGTGLSKGEDLGSSRTLEGVLRGRVPSIFTNLCRNSPSDAGHAVKTNVLSSSSASPVSPTGPASSPRPANSPTITPYTLKRTFSHTEQDEPIDLSCKKMRGDIVNSRLNSPSVESRLDSPTVHSFYPATTPSPGARDMNLSGQKGPSLLRNLLCFGKDLETSHFILNSDDATFTNGNGRRSVPTDDSFSEGLCRQQHTNSSSPIPPRSHGRFTPQDDVCVRNSAGTANPLTKVTLAKKNMLPVSARVSDWLVKIIRFAKSIPEFMSLLHNDKLALILNSWARLLLLYMAENNFQFAVTPDSAAPSPPVQCPESTTHQESPTMKSVESVQSFIRKCQNMGTDSKEYAFLRMAVLFNAGK